MRVNDDPRHGALAVVRRAAVAPERPHRRRLERHPRQRRARRLPAVLRLLLGRRADLVAERRRSSPAVRQLVGWPQQNKIGDYYALVSDATGADVAYAATFNGEQDVYYVRVFPDCNGNGVSDVADVAGGTSQDCDANRVPDECRIGPPDCLGAGSAGQGASAPYGEPGPRQ